MHWDEIIKQYTKNILLKTNNSLAEFEKDIKELKDREINITNRIEELFSKPINTSIQDMDKLRKRIDEEAVTCKIYSVRLVN